MGKMNATKKCCLFKENFRVVCFIGIKVQNVLPSCAHPFRWHTDKMQDKGLQSACLFQWLNLFADTTNEIEIEVLQHGCNHHENHILCHEGKGQMRPSEVIVLYVEVLFACSTLIVECNDVFFCRCPVVGEGYSGMCISLRTYPSVSCRTCLSRDYVVRQACMTFLR